MEERNSEVRKYSLMQSSAELHGKDRMRKALISSNAINNININK